MIDDFVDNPRVRVLGFTEQMCAYMQASDLLDSKAGGLTTAEAVASRTPLLYLRGARLREPQHRLHDEPGVALVDSDQEDDAAAVRVIVAGPSTPRPCCAAGRVPPATPPQPFCDLACGAPTA